MDEDEHLNYEVTIDELFSSLTEMRGERDALLERVKTLEAAMGNLLAIGPPGMTVQVKDDKVFQCKLYQIQFGVCTDLLDGTNAAAVEIVNQVGREWFSRLIDKMTPPKRGER